MAQSAKAAERTETDDVRPGFDAFVRDGGEKFGTVREVDGGELTIYVENAGDFRIPRNAVVGVHAQKIVVDCRRVDRSLCEAIGHAHEAEEPGL